MSSRRRGADWLEDASVELSSDLVSLFPTLTSSTSSRHPALAKSVSEVSESTWHRKHEVNKDLDENDKVKLGRSIYVFFPLMACISCFLHSVGHVRPISYRQD